MSQHVCYILHYFKSQVRISFTWYDAFDKGSLWGYRKSCKYNDSIVYIVEALLTLLFSGLFYLWLLSQNLIFLNSNTNSSLLFTYR